MAYVFGDQIDAMFTHFEAAQFGSGEEGLAAIAVATQAINDAWREAVEETPREGYLGIVAGDRIERLRNWIRRLRDLVRRVAADFRAAGFSISVGTGVSVSVNFEVG